MARCSSRVFSSRMTVSGLHCAERLGALPSAGMKELAQESLRVRQPLLEKAARRPRRRSSRQKTAKAPSRRRERRYSGTIDRRRRAGAAGTRSRSPPGRRRPGRTARPSVPRSSGSEPAEPREVDLILEPLAGEIQLGAVDPVAPEVRRYSPQHHRRVVGDLLEALRAQEAFNRHVCPARSCSMPQRLTRSFLSRVKRRANPSERSTSDHRSGGGQRRRLSSQLFQAGT